MIQHNSTNVPGINLIFYQLLFIFGKKRTVHFEPVVLVFSEPKKKMRRKWKKKKRQGKKKIFVNSQ